ncbi:hypothetical protein PV11_01067 [Exophiala sideris]|uniref:Uncharacterized protein n=1 Tax=Exophiala sideris TaxID=1016849 RepID=A0A0D1XBS7_9EURO|nr:hypothetical protein PV11_01067 [Exophiala sideris]
MDFNWARARKRLSSLKADTTACFYDFRRLIPPERAKEAFSRGGGLASNVFVMNGPLSNSFLYILDTCLKHFEDYRKMNLYELVRSTIRLAEDLLAESIKLLTTLERRRRVEFFMIAAADRDAISSSRSEDHVADMVYNVVDLKEEQSKVRRRMFDQGVRWLAVSGRMSAKDAERNLRRFGHMEWPPPHL